MKLEVVSRHPEGSAGPALLFVHGSGHAAWCWEEHFLEFFAANGFDAYALSLRGHGRSEGKARLRWTSVADYVEDVRSVALDLPSPPVLVGHSLGGLVVQKYLERFDARGAVLLAPSPVRGMFLPGFRISIRHPLLMAWAHLNLEPGILVGTPERARRLLFSSSLPDQDLRRHASRLGRESFRAMCDMTFDLPNVRRIRQGGCPMLVLGGADDAIVSPSDVEATAKAYGAPVRILDSMGHDLMLDTHWEQVAAYLLDWLAATVETRPNRLPSLTIGP